MLLSGMCSQSWKINTEHCGTTSLCEPYLFIFFPKRSLRILNKLICSRHVGVGKGRSVGSAVEFLPLRNSLSWCHKKKQDLTNI